MWLNFDSEVAKLHMGGTELSINSGLSCLLSDLNVAEPSTKLPCFFFTSSPFRNKITLSCEHIL